MKKTIILIFALFLMISCGGDDPEAEAAQGAKGVRCYPNRTCDDGLECSDEGRCIETADHGDSQDTSDTGDNTDSSSENEQADSSADTEPSGETDGKCGNGVVESGEICEKGETKPCSEIDSSYKTGDVKCNDACSGWLTVNCMASELEPLATFPARKHELDYLYDGASAFNEMANQEDELWKSALFNASITMNGESYSIPHPQANTHWIAAYYDSSALYFYQASFSCDDEMNCQYATPGVMFGAALSDLSAGKDLSIGISDKHKVNMLIEDIIGEDDCVMLVGYGTLTVDSVKIAAGNAGNFKFTTSKIGLYLPVATPEGDMTGELEEAGYKICK